ncbi:MAG: hypothetical protein HZC28_00840 [Spirochaetes bacterium]|nr:hypothetical protein [Spirochaetota bacterium]
MPWVLSAANGGTVTASNFIGLRDIIEQGFNQYYTNDYIGAIDTFAAAQTECVRLTAHFSAQKAASTSTNTPNNALLPRISPSDSPIIFCRKYLKSALDAYIIFDNDIILTSLGKVSEKINELQQATLLKKRETQKSKIRRLQEFMTIFSNDLNNTVPSGEVSHDAYSNLQFFLFSNFQVFSTIVSNDIEDLKRRPESVGREELLSNIIYFSNQFDMYSNYFTMQNFNIAALISSYSNYLYNILSLEERMRLMERHYMQRPTMTTQYLVSNVVTVITQAGKSPIQVRTINIPSDTTPIIRPLIREQKPALPVAPIALILIIVSGAILLFSAAFLLFRHFASSRPGAAGRPRMNIGYLKDYIDKENEITHTDARKK